MKLVWFPQWACQNYDRDRSFSARCPYCPYGMKDDRLLFEDQLTASNDLADWQPVLDFFRANAAPLRRFLEVSGGEPLLYPHLHRVLGDLVGWRWAITSNSVHTPMIARLAEAGVLGRCYAWTASYHPISGRDAEFSQSIRLLKARKVGGRVRATVVVAPETVEDLPRTLAFLKGLPLDGCQFHLDTHRPTDVQALRRRAREVAPKVRITAGTGEVPANILCAKHSDLMALGPDGTLYECVTKAYRDMDPICKVDGKVLLDRLPRRDEFCPVPCFAVCDHVKHIQRNAVPLTVGGV